MQDVLSVRGLAAGYGPKTVVEDLSFSVAPGEILALLGHNGAGKSTTLKALVGQVAARDGGVHLDGADLQALDVAGRVGKGLRLMPEGSGLFPTLTVAENLDVVSALNCGASPTFTVADVLGIFPVLAERLASRAGDLSGGQQRMLAFGLAILGSPRCLLLDEPSVGLAPNLVERLLGQVHAVCKSRSLGAILVEQNIAAALKVADRVAILNNGSLIFTGTREEAERADLWEYF
jgi:branched-chain amino acid transport system ATP-binding protein